MHKKLFLTLTCFVLLIAFSACTKQKDVSNVDQEKITVVLDWTPNTNHTGLYVAKAKGYFAKNGLDVNILQPGEDGAEMMVSTGKAQFGISFQDYIVHGLISDTPLEITAVAAILQHNCSGILSLKSKGISSPKLMENHSYATWDLPVEKAMIKEVVEKDGGNFSKIKLQPSNITDEVAALKTESVDSIWVFYGWGGIATELAGLETNYFAFADISPEFDYYTPVIIGNNTYLKDKPKVVKKFLNAVKLGYEFAIKNPTEATDILVKEVPELSKDLVLESQKYMADKYKSEVKTWGYIDVKRWDRFYTWLYDKKLIDKKLESGCGFTNDYLSK